MITLKLIKLQSQFFTRIMKTENKVNVCISYIPLVLIVFLYVNVEAKKDNKIKVASSAMHKLHGLVYQYFSYTAK